MDFKVTKIVSYQYNSCFISYKYITDQSSKRNLVGTTAVNVDIYWSWAELCMHYLTKLPTTNLFLLDIIPVLTALNIVLTSHLR